MNPYYNFLLYMWILRKADKEYLQIRVDKKQITQEEYENIIKEPQI